MTTLVEPIRGVNVTIQERTIRHQMMVYQFAEGEAVKVRRLLLKAQEDLLAKINTRLTRIIERGYDTGPWTTRRLQELSQSISTVARDWGSKSYVQLRDDLLALAKDEVEFNQALVEEVLPVHLETVLPAPALLRAIVISQPFMGATMRSWFDTLTTDVKGRLNQAIQMGLTQGETVDQITRRLKDVFGVAPGTRNRAFTRQMEAVARTATSHVNSRARELWMDENADIIAGVQWVSTLDTRTCLTCIKLDKHVWKEGDKKAKRPPAHWNCRCTIIPYLKHPKDLGLPWGEWPEGTRAAWGEKPGQVPGNLNYVQWLRTQPSWVQDQALGKARAALWRAGKYDVTEFTVDGRTLTLKQLAQMEGRKPQPSTRRSVAAERASARDKERQAKLAILNDKAKPIAQRLAAYQQGDEITAQMLALDQGQAKEVTELHHNLMFLKARERELLGLERNSAIDKELESIAGEQLSVQEAISTSQDRMRQSARALMEKTQWDYAQDRTSVQHVDISVLGSTKARREQLRDRAHGAYQWLKRMCPRVKENVEWRISTRARAEAARVYRPQGWMSQLRMGYLDSLEDYAHELGHHLERNYETVYDAAKAFRDYRCGTEIPSRFKSLWPHAGYRGSEIGCKDDFVRLWTALEGNAAKAEKWGYYTGKLYSHPSTEIISMGLQAMYKDPVTFAKVDPEYFKFMVGIFNDVW